MKLRASPSCALACGLLLAGIAGAQPPSGRVAVRLAATLGSAGDNGEITAYPSSVARDSRGRFFVSLPHAPPLVFDSTGTFLRSLGVVGSGPGEVRKVVRILVGTRDTLLLVDQWLSRITVLTPSFQLVRTIPAREYDNAILLSDGTVIATSDLATTIQFDRLSPDGKILPSYMEQGERCVLGRQCWAHLARVLAAAPDGGFWTASRYLRYTIERRTGTGQLTKAIQPANPWFQPYDSVVSASSTVAPQASLSGMWSDSRGRVWVVGNTADSLWRRARWGLGPRREGSATPVPVDVDELLDGFIQVVDTESGDVIAQARVPYRIDGVIGSGLFYSVTSDRDGFHFIKIYEVLGGR